VTEATAGAKVERVPASPQTRSSARTRKPALDPTAALLRQRFRTLFSHYPKAIAGDEESVHQLRVSGRRLRIALPLLACKPKGKRMRRVDKAVKKLIAKAGTGRDLDVILFLFERETAAECETRPELKALRCRLRIARGCGRARMANAMLDLEVASLRRDLRRVLSRGAKSLFAVLSRIRTQREREGAALEADVSELGERFDPEALHRIRIRSRRLRYVAEVDAAVKEVPSDAARRFKQLQSRLGLVQDAAVLSAWLGRLAARLERRGPEALASEARRQEARFLELSRRRHRDFLEKDPAAHVRQGVAALGYKAADGASR
jgi:CHAD domain-containing protein